ncbi:MAG: hypothetical protein U0228_19795 [Myxococcaceae bacterium]
MWIAVGLLVALGQVDAPPAEAADAGTSLVPNAPPVIVVEHDVLGSLFHGSALITRTPLLYEASFVVGAGGLIHAPGLEPVPLTGIRVTERSGLLSRLLVAFLGNALQGLAAVKIDSMSRELHRETVIDNGKVYEKVTMITTTTFSQTKPPEQVEREQKEFRDSLGGVTWLDLTVYGSDFLGWKRGANGGNGYELSVGFHFELFAFLGLPAILDLGLQLANVRIPMPALPGFGGRELTWASGGILQRFHLPLTRFATLSLEWIFNFLTIDYALREDAERWAEGSLNTSPLRLGVEVYATDAVVLRAQAVLGGLGFTDGRLGWLLSAGVRL